MSKKSSVLVEGEEVILSDYFPTRCEQQYEIRVQKPEARDNQICNPPPDHCHHISINLPLEKKKKKKYRTTRANLSFY